MSLKTLIQLQSPFCCPTNSVVIIYKSFFMRPLLSFLKSLATLSDALDPFQTSAQSIHLSYHILEVLLCYRSSQLFQILLAFYLSLQFIFIPLQSFSIQLDLSEQTSTALSQPPFMPKQPFDLSNCLVVLSLTTSPHKPSKSL